MSDPSKLSLSVYAMVPQVPSIDHVLVHIAPELLVGPIMVASDSYDVCVANGHCYGENTTLLMERVFHKINRISDAPDDLFTRQNQAYLVIANALIAALPEDWLAREDTFQDNNILEAKRVVATSTAAA